MERALGVAVRRDLLGELRQYRTAEGEVTHVRGKRRETRDHRALGEERRNPMGNSFFRERDFFQNQCPKSAKDVALRLGHRFEVRVNLRGTQVAIPLPEERPTREAFARALYVCATHADYVAAGGRATMLHKHTSRQLRGGTKVPFPSCAESQHECTQERQGDDDECECGTLTRDDAKYHPARDRRQPHLYARADRVTVLMSNKHNQPTGGEPRGEGPRRRHDSRKTLCVVVI